MRTRVQKWGNSLAIRIPKPFAEEAGFAEATEVEIELEAGELRVAPVPPRWDLNSLLSKVTASNRHDEVDLGSLAGREIW